MSNYYVMHINYWILEVHDVMNEIVYSQKRKKRASMQITKMCKNIGIVDTKDIWKRYNIGDMRERRGEKFIASPI